MDELRQQPMQISLVHAEHLNLRAICQLAAFGACVVSVVFLQGSLTGLVSVSPGLPLRALCYSEQADSDHPSRGSFN